MAGRQLMRVKRRTFAVALAVVALAGGSVVAVRELSGTGLRPIPGSVLSALAHSRLVGPVPSPETLTATVGLRVPGEATALATLHSSSPSPRGDHPRLSVSQGEIDTVEGYLRGHGLSAKQLRRRATTIEVRGSASEMEAAFGSKLSDWRRGNETYFANDSTLVLPEDIADDVTGVLGLDDYGRVHATTTNSGGETPNPINPEQIREAYGAKALTDSDSCGPRHTPCNGSGEQVAIFAMDGVDTNAIWNFDKRYASDHAAGIEVTWFNARGKMQGAALCPIGQNRTSPCGPTQTPTPTNGLGVEVEMDIESVQTMAPDATIDVLEFPVTTNAAIFGTELSEFLTFEVSRAAVLSVSFGACETFFTTTQLEELDQQFGQLVLRGSSVFASSGDSGRNCTSGGLLGLGSTPGVKFPASDPNVTSVGGTTLTLVKTKFGHEVPWDTEPKAASGGGVSSYFGTSVPDVAAAATIYGYGWDGSTFQNRSGTSAAAPLWAGAAALLDQYGRSRAPGFTLGLAYQKLDTLKKLYGSNAPGLHPITRKTKTSDLYAKEPIEHSVGIGSFTVDALALALTPTMGISAVATANGEHLKVTFVGSPYPKNSGTTVAVVASQYAFCTAYVQGRTASCEFSISEGTPPQAAGRPGRVLTVVVDSADMPWTDRIVSVTVGSEAAPQGVWTARSVPAGVQFLNDVVCPSDTQCYAVGGWAYGSGPGWIIGSSNGGDSWQLLDTTPKADFESLACPSAQECLVVGGVGAGNTPEALVTIDGGRSWTSGTLPSQLGALGDVASDVACVSDTSCIVVGLEVARTTDGGWSWALENLPSGFGFADSVTCPTTAFCVIGGAGVDSGSPSVDSVSSDGGASWTAAVDAGGPPDLDQVSCSDAQYCVGLLHGGGADTYPADSPVVTADGGKSWKAVPATVGDALSCVQSFCVSVGGRYESKTNAISGDAFVSANGGLAWSAMSLPASEGLTAVTCLSSSDCIAVGGSANDNPSSDTTAVILTYGT